jgi:hypothetical protein
MGQPTTLTHQCCWLATLLFVIYTASGRSGIAVEASKVALNKNGYDDLVVAISTEAPVAQAETIIDNIKVYILKEIKYISNHSVIFLIHFIFDVENDTGSLAGALQGDRKSSLLPKRSHSRSTDMDQH